jgi:hypothetical protein
MEAEYMVALTRGASFVPDCSKRLEKMQRENATMRINLNAQKHKFEQIMIEFKKSD